VYLLQALKNDKRTPKLNVFWEYAFAIDKYLCCGELWGLLEGLTMLWPTVRRHKCHRSSFVFSADWFLHFGSVLFRRQTQQLQPNSAQYDGNCITGGILMLRLSHYKGHLFRPSGPQRCSYSPVSQPGQRASTSWLAACSPRLLGPSSAVCYVFGDGCWVPMWCTTPSSHTLSHRMLYQHTKVTVAGNGIDGGPKAAKFKLCHTGTTNWKRE